MEQTFHILVVDDDPNVLAAYVHALKRVEGVTVHQAEDRATAKAILKKFRLTEGEPANANQLIAVAFIDQNLGDFNPQIWRDDIRGAEGLALVPYIKEFVSRPTRVVMLTAYQGTSDDQGFLAGRDRADGYLKKIEGDDGNFAAQVSRICREEIPRFAEAVRLYNLKLEDKR